MGGWDVVPWGLKRLLLYIHRIYEPPGGIVITENGTAVQEPDAVTAKCDTFRQEYFQTYIAQVHAAIVDGADVRGYFAWSLMDNFEWQAGYSKRFGMVRVDYGTLERTPKASAWFFSK